MNKYEQSLMEATDIILKYIDIFTTKFPYSHSENNFYKQSDNIEWTTGFYTGILWLCYENTKEEKFLKSANIQVDSFYNRIKNKIDTNHHDMGFLYSPSCVAAYK